MEIARLDENGILIGIEPCSAPDHKTDPMVRSVRLDGNHDVHNMIGQYRWDYNANTFVPLSLEPFAVVERDNTELVEGFVEVIEDMLDYFDEVVSATNDIVDFVDTEQPVQALKGTFGAKGKKPKKVRKFIIPERTARTIKQFRREKPRRARMPDTTIQAEYHVVSREPEEDV